MIYNLNVLELLFDLRRCHNLFPKRKQCNEFSTFRDELSNRVDACNKIVCNRPSKLQLIALNFVREHRLCLWHRSYYTDDPVEKCVQHVNTERIPNFHHTSKLEMKFPDFLLPKPNRKDSSRVFIKFSFLTSISSSK